MARIKIKDLPKTRKLTEQEIRRIRGGAFLYRTILPTTISQTPTYSRLPGPQPLPGQLPVPQLGDSVSPVAGCDSGHCAVAGVRS